MNKSKIKINAIIDKTRPTTNKNVIVSNGYRLLKIDKVDNHPISEKILSKIKNFIVKIKKVRISFVMSMDLNLSFMLESLMKTEI